MNDFFRRGGHEPYARARAPSTFRDSLAELRDRVRDGLAEAASRAVSGAVRRAAECLLGVGVEEGTRPARSHRRQGYDAGWGHHHEDEYGDGWDDHWHDEPPGRWGGRDGDEQEDAADGRGGSWRLVVAACCQAAASVIRTASPGWTLGPLACAVLSVLALLLGGGRLACEAGLALAEAAWTLAEALTAGNDNEE